MKADRELDEILAEIGREHRAMDAPERLESVLLDASAERRSALGAARGRTAWAWAAVAILLAAVAMGGVIWQARRSHQEPNPQAQKQQAPFVPAPRVGAEPSRASTQVSRREDVHPAGALLRRAGTERAGLRKAAAKQSTWNSLDEFVPLPVSEGLPPAAELSLVRIKLRGSDLQQYGLETPADAEARAMLAEFVVGEDGLPRAIRIVR